MGTTDASWIAACHRFEAMTVAEADRLMNVAPTLVRAGDPLLAVALEVVHHPECRVLSVVDEAGRLLGLLPVADVAFAAFVRVMPEVFLKHVNDMEHSSRFAALSDGRTAGEVMRPPLALRPDDRLEEAFDRLLGADLEGLPIVSETGVVTGYLNLPEFLSAWLASSAPEGLEKAR